MPESSPQSIRKTYKAAFIKGIAAILPTVLTIYILLATYGFVDENVASPINGAIKGWLKTDSGRPVALRFLDLDPELLRSGLESEFDVAVDESFPAWVGFVAAIVICFLVGFFIASFLGRRIWAVFEGWFMKMPVVRAIYPSAKQITEFFFKDPNKEQQFSRVAFVPFPAEDQWSLGFVMAGGFKEMDEAKGVKHLTVFIPMAPTPVTGFVVLIPEHKVHMIDISVDEAFKYYVTAGLVIPPRHRLDPAAEPDPAVALPEKEAV
ncbi:MAG: DUF502 domain-containing protein [Planctomycetota bacterium]